MRVRLVPIVTRGDRTLGDLSAVGGKGLFTEELEAGLADGSLDLAVHSLKDLPVELPEGLVLAAFPPRADPRDVLICSTTVATDDGGIAALPPGTVVLTGSLRRRAQTLALRPDLQVEGIRGNVGTRIDKWRSRGDGHALLLAKAGLERLGIASRERDNLPGVALSTEEMLPAPGQGILAIETAADSEAARICAALGDAATTLAARAERALVAGLGADCNLPLAALATATGQNAVRLDVKVLSEDGRRVLSASETGPPEDAAGRAADALLAAGAREFLTARESADGT